MRGFECRPQQAKVNHSNIHHSNSRPSQEFDWSGSGYQLLEVNIRLSQEGSGYHGIATKQIADEAMEYVSSNLARMAASQPLDRLLCPTVTQSGVSSPKPSLKALAQPQPSVTPSDFD